jgi:hypothetical protein
MLSQSARATSAAESRFRIQAPNASPRAILAIAPGAEGKRLAEGLAPARAVRWLCGGKLGDQNWEEALKGFDLALLIGEADQLAAGIGALGEACRAAGIKLSAIVVDPPLRRGALGGGGARSSACDAKGGGGEELRPWARTITRIADPQDLAGLLEALGA